MNRKFRSMTAALSALIALGMFSAAEAPQIINTAAEEKILAFPGATGAGKYATGGRGGEVYHVTNLNDSGEGSFRDAVSKSGRIVVFDVSGTIELKGNILCSGNVTIAGQTAPGGSGITLKNYKMGMSGDNIICRYISSRPGPYASTTSGNDAWGGAKGSYSIIDHCSMGWTTDEQWGLYSNNTNYTVQYSVIGPADSWGGHKKGLHGFGIMMGKGDLSFDHNLIIHNVSRNFRGKVPGTYTADFTNNIIYDWGYQTAYGTIGHLNYANNTLKAGNSTTGGYHWIYVDSTTSPQNFKVYCSGNRMINKDGSLNGITYNNWDGITVKESIGITKDNLYSASPFSISYNGENVSSVPTAESAEASYNHVIAFAGNGISSDKRTAIDRQCAEETAKGTGSCSGTSAYDSSVTDLNKYNIKCGVTYQYPSAVTKKEITDKDNDGMDDNWELERGLNPSDASDSSGDYCGQGYTNIEYYINDLTVNSFPEGVVKLSPLESVPSVSAFETIEAESFKEQSGIVSEESDGFTNIGYIENGDYAMYSRIDFADGARNFTARLSGNPAIIELYLDSLNNEPKAVIQFEGTGSFSSYKSVTFGIPEITGTHNLYLKFTGGEGYLLNADSFVFGKEKILMSGSLLKNIDVDSQAGPDFWMIEKNAAENSKVFGDRDFTITKIPEALIGAEILKTSCDAKETTGNTASFTAGKDIDLYIALDNRVETVPDFLTEYEKTNETVELSNDVIFDLYKKSYKAGEEITTGSNGQTYKCVNFTIFAAETTVNEIKGDVNSDGECTVADLVMLSRHLLNMTSFENEKQFTAADVFSDGIIDAYDIVMLRKMVTAAK